MQFHRNKFKIAAQNAVYQGDYVPPALVNWEGDSCHSQPVNIVMFVGSHNFLETDLICLQPAMWTVLFTSWMLLGCHQMLVLCPRQRVVAPHHPHGLPLPPATQLWRLLPARGMLGLWHCWIGSRKLTVNSCLAYREMNFKFLCQCLLLQDTNFFSSISLCIYLVLLDDEIWLMGTLIIAASKWRASGKIIITYSKVFTKRTYPE